MSALSANRRNEEVCGGSRIPIRVSVPLAARARALFPIKTAAHLSEITGFSQRACEAWLACDAKIPSDAVAALLRSPWGFEFLLTVMGESRAPWWAWLRRMGLVVNATRRRAADRRLIERALDADDELAATLARATTALCVQDQDFGGLFADGFRDMARAPDRAVVATAATGRAAASASSVLGKGRRS